MCVCVCVCVCSAEELRILRGEQEVNENNLRLDLTESESGASDDLSERSMDQAPRAGGGGTQRLSDTAKSAGMRSAMAGNLATSVRGTQRPGQVRDGLVICCCVFCIDVFRCSHSHTMSFTLVCAPLG